MSTAIIFRKGLCSLLNSAVIDILAKSTGTDKAVDLLIKDKNYGERFLSEERPRVYLGVGFAGKEIGYKISHAQLNL